MADTPPAPVVYSSPISDAAGQALQKGVTFVNVSLQAHGDIASTSCQGT